MSNLNTIVEYGCLSDEQRWDAKRYEWNWLSELNNNDKDIIRLLDCISDGEFSGQASVVQIYDLLFSEIRNGYPKERVHDWAEVLMYLNIIVYEETRHGLSLSTAYHYVKNERLDYSSSLSIQDYSRKYVWCFEERRYWDLYSFTISHLFGEVVNTEMYRDISKQVCHPKLKELISNIMKDEARHTRAWAEIIKNLVHSHPVHKHRALETIDIALTHHNAMVHETYFEGQNKVMEMFLPSSTGKGAIENIVKKKYALMEEIFEEDNPYTMDKIRDQHVSFLLNALGKKRAVYSPDYKDGIKFT